MPIMTRRWLSLAAVFGIHLRYLHDGPAAQEDAVGEFAPCNLDGVTSVNQRQLWTTHHPLFREGSRSKRRDAIDGLREGKKELDVRY